MSDDPQLLRRYAIEGDQDAFAELVRRHLPVVYNAALRRVNGNTHLAEEATQIVFIQLARKARSLLHHPALLGWLHTSTRYAATLLLRREQRLTERHELFGAMNLEPDPALPWERARPLIDAALDSLSAFDRQAVLLRFFSNRSYAEVAENLHISEEAARKRVDRAIDALPRQFRRRGVATSASALAAALAAAPEYAAPPALAGTITSAATLAAGTGSASIASGFLASMSTLKLSSATFVICSLLGLATFGGATAYWWHDQHARNATANRQFASASTRRPQVAQISTTTAVHLPGTSPAPAPDPDIVPTQQPGELRMIIKAAAWKDLGYRTPANVLQTYFRAIRDGDLDSLERALYFDDQTRFALAELFNTLSAEEQRHFRTPERFACSMLCGMSDVRGYIATREKRRDGVSMIAILTSHPDGTGKFHGSIMDFQQLPDGSWRVAATLRTVVQIKRLLGRPSEFLSAHQWP